MDSQPAGGRFDGIYGVLAAFEAMQALDDAGVATRRPIDVVAWTNEEGGRFERSCTGSSVWAGQSPLRHFSTTSAATGSVSPMRWRRHWRRPPICRAGRRNGPLVLMWRHIEQARCWKGRASTLLR